MVPTSSQTHLAIFFIFRVEAVLIENTMRQHPAICRIDVNHLFVEFHVVNLDAPTNLYEQKPK